MNIESSWLLEFFIFISADLCVYPTAAFDVIIQKRFHMSNILASLNKTHYNKINLLDI